MTSQPQTPELQAPGKVWLQGEPSAGVAWSILGTRHVASWWGDPVLGEIGAEILAFAKRRE